MSFSTKMLSVAAIVLVAICALAIPVFLAQPPIASQPTSAPTSVNQATAASGVFQVFFTTPKYPDKAADHIGSIDIRLAAFINTAKQSVDMAIYQLDLPNVTQSLLDAKNRGAAVRVVTHIDILNDPDENPSFKKLEQAGIPVVGGNPNAIMHNKFVVVDGAAVWTGSWNFTENDTYRYNNNGALIQSAELAHNYTVTFEKMFSDKKFGASRKAGGTVPHISIGGSAVENYFAPEDKVTDKVVARLKTAAKTIDFMAFSFTEDDIGKAVMDRASGGVRVRGVFETTGSETKFSEYGAMKSGGLDVWQDGNPYLMHHKVFVIDNQSVIFGSFNFTVDANKENDENLLMVDDPSLAAQFEAEFARVYGQAKNPPPKK